MESNNPFTGKSVLVCMQHALTEEQRQDVSSAKQLHFLITQAPELFAQVANIPPDIEQIQMQKLAFKVAKLAAQYDVAILPIGSPEFQFMLAAHLISLTAPEVSLAAPTVVFARTRREAAEATTPDGSVAKISVFRHAGWGVL